MNIKVYLIVITIISLITSLATCLYYDVSYFYCLGVMWLGILLVIVIDGVVAGICRVLPQKVADFNKKIYVVSKNEKKFYEKIKIKFWKEKIPEIGHLTGFRKNKVTDPKSKEYIERFLIEICYGELGHFVGVFAGLLLFLFPFFKPVWLVLCIVIVIFNAILSLLPVFVLRYNSYALMRIYQRLSRLENKNNSAEGN